jgi:hypothetical protein
VSDLASHDFALVTKVLDPVLEPLGFARGQGGRSGARGQVIFCRGVGQGGDGACVDLVIDLEAAPEWRVVDVRYWGFPADRWHLEFDSGARLAAQLTGLALTLRIQLG